ncbi:MAG: hypothetical protein KGH60_03145 [Candidatus Micrarchaeota archaeon]|nr:hypothetical protein [Candidatus Micrarchaeota archaeon]
MQKSSAASQREEAINGNRERLAAIAIKRFDVYVGDAAELEQAYRFMEVFGTHLPGLAFFLRRRESGEDTEHLEIDAVREAVAAMLKSLDTDELADLHVDIENKIVEMEIKPNEKDYVEYVNNRYIWLKKLLEESVDTFEAIVMKINDSYLDALLELLKETEARLASAFQSFSASDKTMASYEEFRLSMAGIDRDTTKLTLRLMEGV